MKYIIIDLDGTLANCDHRQHLVQGDKKDWRAFFLACSDDKPNEAAILICNAICLYLSTPNKVQVIIFSGRSDIASAETIAWLEKHHVSYDDIWMRREGDYTPDEKLKADWAQSLGWDNILFVIDDRQKVVDMWRRNGVTCFQVAPGDF